MSAQTALWLDDGNFIIAPKDTPHPGSGEVLVKNLVAALDPLDWVIRDYGFYMVKEYPAVIGEEGAGVVEETGDGVTTLVKGDKVFYQSYLTNRCPTFQHFSVIPVELVGKVPDTISLDQAASISAGIAPPALGLYAQQPQGLDLLAPWEEGGKGKYNGQPIIVVGGASSLGQYGYLGATHIIDRKLPAASFQEQVAKITSAPVELAFAAICYPDTQQALYDVLAPEGKMIVTRRPEAVRKEGDQKMVHFVNGSFHLPGNKEFSSRFMRALTRMTADGEIKTPAVEVIPNGLNGVVLGMERLKSESVSGKTLVVHPWET
ncbi:GroES-like protein [Leucogyrophana mollusca]|uniref:GroES-like protein n=1 Tax=Leucogyrophana mollusca TaxID=85980 RepID=A0ACB8BF16_9AGAM|nr:GroES-like protein [Leucogyrophana mollusca]